MHTLPSVSRLLVILLLGSAACTLAEPDTTNPCELLTKSLVRSHYDVAEGTSIEQDDRSSSRFPNCGYRWRVMSEADEQAALDANQAKLMDNIKAGRSPNEGINHNIPTHRQTRLTVAEFDSQEKALNGLEGARATVIQRDEQRGRAPTPWEPVANVGGGAYYHGRQLSFTWGRFLLHLDASPRDRAVALAKALME